MRTFLTVFCSAVVVNCAAVCAAQQSDRPASKTPGKGDTILVKGCLSGNRLDSTETSFTDETGMVVSRWTYQLKGDKPLLKQMREKHDGHLVDVTGVLKSTLPQNDATHEKRIGKTRITLGIGSPANQREPASEPLPILEVKSFEGHPTRCVS